MNTLSNVLQIIIALGILNVWIIRYSKKTKWRGSSSHNMREEFAVYGLPKWFMVAVGSVKLLLSLVLVLGIWLPLLAVPAAGLMSILMIGAIYMHLKVKDPFLKAVPALVMLLLSLGIMFLRLFS